MPENSAAQRSWLPKSRSSAWANPALGAMAAVKPAK